MKTRAPRRPLIAYVRAAPKGLRLALWFVTGFALTIVATLAYVLGPWTEPTRSSGALPPTPADNHEAVAPGWMPGSAGGAGGGVGPPRVERVLLVGASSMQHDLGKQLEKRLGQYEELTVMRCGRHSSGLARPDYFDWAATLGELKGEFGPDLIIAQWGENDCQVLSTRDGKQVAFLAGADVQLEVSRRPVEEVRREVGRRHIAERTIEVRLKVLVEP